MRHARASNFYIDLTRGAGERGAVVLEMRDDGQGFDPGSPRWAGGGLTGMRERAALLGGHFELLSGPGQGVTIRIEIPVGQEDA